MEPHSSTHDKEIEITSQSIIMNTISVFLVLQLDFTFSSYFSIMWLKSNWYIAAIALTIILLVGITVFRFIRMGRNKTRGGATLIHCYPHIVQQPPRMQVVQGYAATPSPAYATVVTVPSNIQIAAPSAPY